GNVLWEKKVDGPLAAQRLPNGNTFIATRYELLEVNRDGKQVFSHARPGEDLIMKAQKLANGDIGMVIAGADGRSTYVRLDSRGALGRGGAASTGWRAVRCWPGCARRTRWSSPTPRAGWCGGRSSPSRWRRCGCRTGTRW